MISHCFWSAFGLSVTTHAHSHSSDYPQDCWKLPFVWFSNLKSCYTRLYIPYFIHLLPFPIDSCISNALAYPSSYEIWLKNTIHPLSWPVFILYNVFVFIKFCFGADLLTWPNLCLCSHPICYNLLKLLDILSTLLLENSNQDNRK